MGDLTKYFSRREFACKCNCGYDGIDPRVVMMAQKIRDALGEPVKINSGCRCPARNKEADGVPSSYHTQGKAADLSCASGAARMYAVIQTLFKDGRLNDLAYCKYYVSKNFVHIDCGKARNTRFVKG